MRKLYALLLVYGAMPGCNAQRGLVDSAASWSRLKPRMPTTAPDSVELHYVFIQRSDSNPELGESLWNKTDEMAVSLEKKKTLEENGFRVGKMGKRLPAELLDLLETGTASGNGRRVVSHSGNLTKIQLTDVVPEWTLFTVANGQPGGEVISAAQGYLHITPTIGEKDSVQLQLVPEVEHGARKSIRMPAPDLSGWQIRTTRETKSFPNLKVELDLLSGEYTLVGCLPDRAGTLGRQLFTQTVDGQELQTVLLIRALRPSRGELAASGYDYDDFFLNPIRRRRPSDDPALKLASAGQ